MSSEGRNYRYNVLCLCGSLGNVSCPRFVCVFFHFHFGPSFVFKMVFMVVFSVTVVSRGAIDIVFKV